jgi:type II secretory pathway pseudopilin PulG
MTSEFKHVRAYTLIELLTVLLVILLISAATLPAVIGGMRQRKVSEAARILQAALVGARDAAIHAGAPRGIRLLADPSQPAGILACNRFAAIEPGGDYTEGRVFINDAWADPMPVAPPGHRVVYESLFDPAGMPNARTSWAWNVRVGDRFRFGDSGRWYTVIGPVAQGNPELFVNYVPAGGTFPMSADGVQREFLWLVNGQDDDRDGYVDEAWDGLDNDLDGAIDNPAPGNGDWEAEAWLGTERSQGATNATYTLSRRPVLTRSARETQLPAGTFIDLTTWDSTRERSRLPVLPGGLVEILINPSGQVVPTTLYSSPSSAGLGASFMHFWLCELDDLHQPVLQANVPYRLPMPVDTPLYPAAGDTNWRSAPLTGERRLVTLFARTGNVVTGPIEPAAPLGIGTPVIYGPGFLGTSVNQPYVGVQLGTREAP